MPKTDDTCPYVLRVPIAKGKFLRFPCIQHIHGQHVAEIPGASTQRKLSDAWADTDGPTRVYWSAPM